MIEYHKYVQLPTKTELLEDGWFKNVIRFDKIAKIIEGLLLPKVAKDKKEYDGSKTIEIGMAVDCKFENFDTNMFDKMINMFLDGIYMKLDEDKISYPLSYVYDFGFYFDQVIFKQNRVGFFGFIDINKDLYKGINNE